jgi:hypothetical protein
MLSYPLTDWSIVIYIFSPILQLQRKGPAAVQRPGRHA